MGWQILFYPTEEDHEPVKEFILQQDYGARHEILHVLELLYKFNIRLGMPYVRKINRSGLRELRIKHGSDIYRIFFFIFTGRKFILLHIIKKKEAKTSISDKQLAIEGQDELQLQVDKITFEQQVFLASFVYTYINLFEGLENNVSTYEEYKPPLVIRQLYKIDETYLI